MSFSERWFRIHNPTRSYTSRAPQQNRNRQAVGQCRQSSPHSRRQQHDEQRPAANHQRDDAATDSALLRPAPEFRERQAAEYDGVVESDHHRFRILGSRHLARVPDDGHGVVRLVAPLAPPLLAADRRVRAGKFGHVVRVEAVRADEEAAGPVGHLHVAVAPLRVGLAVPAEWCRRLDDAPVPRDRFVRYRTGDRAPDRNDPPLYGDQPLVYLLRRTERGGAEARRRLYRPR